VAAAGALVTEGVVVACAAIEAEGAIAVACVLIPRAEGAKVATKGCAGAARPTSAARPFIVDGMRAEDTKGRGVSIVDVAVGGSVGVFSSRLTRALNKFVSPGSRNAGMRTHLAATALATRVSGFALLPLLSPPLYGSVCSFRLVFGRAIITAAVSGQEC
jgi:hypothetical protein